MWITTTGRATLGAILLGALMLLLASPAWAPLIEDRELNFELEIPPQWEVLPKSDSWKEFGIVAGGIRQLDKLKDGTAATGEGGLCHLSIVDAPEGKSLDDLASDAAVKGFLLNRFSQDPAAWPDVKVVPDQWDGGVDVRILTAEGKAPNLKGESSPVRAVMLLVIAKKRLYKLRLYGWRSEHDREGIKGDLDVIEMNFFIPDTKEEKEPEGERPPMEEGDEPTIEGDEGEVVEMGSDEEGWKLVKPKGLKSQEWDKSTYPDDVAWFSANKAEGGYYQIIFTVVRRGRISESGQKMNDIDLRMFWLNPIWETFSKAHPDGEISTFRFPKRGKSWLTLPDFEKEKVIFAKPSRRPAEANASALMKKMKAFEKVKKQKMGKDKTNEAYRGVLAGNLPRQGQEIQVVYTWGTPWLTCKIRISFTRGAHLKFYEPINELLKSIEMTGRPN